jgi:hypothetical protein
MQNRQAMELSSISALCLVFPSFPVLKIQEKATFCCSLPELYQA